MPFPARLLPALLLLSCMPLVPRSRPPSTEVVERTPERVERGRYLVENVCACLYCHSPHDWTKFTGPTLPGHEGEGGVCLDKKDDVNGHVCTENITPHPDGLGSWSDGEIMRAVREGVSRDGRTLFPWMPSSYYRNLSDEDAKAMVAYLRSLPPRAGKQPPTHINWPTSMLINFVPEPLEGPVAPPASDPNARGEYLVKVAACDYCHTNQPRGDREKNADFAGGFVLTGPWGRVVTPNITPHATGLGKYTRDEFIGRFKSYADYDPFSAPRMPSGATVMPWKYYSGMSEEDLGLIYDWLMKQKPVERAVSPFAAVPASKP